MRTNLSALLFRSLVGVAALSAFTSDNALAATSLEVDQIANLHVAESQVGGRQCFEITGIVADSALGIKKIRQTSIGDILSITASLGLADRRHTGGLHYNICPDHPVLQIVFGSKRKQIWKAGA